MSHRDEVLRERLDAASRKLRTPCAGGEMVWRVWGEGRPLLLLHGGYGSWTHWLRNIGTLARSRRVIAADMPGLGESATVPEPYTPESLADVMIAGLDAVLGGEPATLVGFSFGAMLGGHVAARSGGRIRALVVVGPNGMGPPYARQTGLVRVRPEMSQAEIAATQRANLATLMFADPARIDDFAVRLQAENALRARIRSRPFAATETLISVLPDVPGRVDAIWGERDVTAVPHLAERVAKLRRARSEARVEVIAGAGHWVQYEAAEAFDRALGKLL
jgi:pimeloyl-ACP methyl ester carboxylesterase